MRLLPIPDASGEPMRWINSDHPVSVQPIYRRGESGLVHEAELKVDGLPLQRIPLGEHPDRDRATSAFNEFLRRLQE